jgi:DNA-binding transcriptional MerR regulator
LEAYVLDRNNPAIDQPALFDLTDAKLPNLNLGYRGPIACTIAGISYRQLDYWARTELVTPSIQSAAGSGSQRLYSFTDMLVLKIVKKLLDAGVSLQNIRTAVEHLRSRGIADLSSITLMSDGASVYECTSAEDVIDLVRGGQGVFGIAIGQIWQDMAGELALLPNSGESVVPLTTDELAIRRNKRQTA